MLGHRIHEVDTRQPPLTQQTSSTLVSLNIVQAQKLDERWAVKQIRGQSNLAKAASNAPHTLHAQDCLALSVTGTFRRLQKLEVGHVTPPPISYDLLLHFFL